MKLVIKNNGKNNDQSYMAKVVMDDGIEVFSVYGFGSTEEEAVADLKEMLIPICSNTLNLLEDK